MDQLCNEDQLRLNVLLAQPLQAVRIDEAKMEVHALSEKGNATVALHPNCKEERYIRLVKQTISSHILGSPGGYPVYLKRWTRMGQARRESLEKLLLLGEPEAVAAVVYASGLTNEIARRAWWCENSAEHARRLLATEEIAQGSMGPVLAEFLLEFLPFEETAIAMIETVRLVLQPGLIDSKMREDLWSRARRRNTYYVGFLWHPELDLPAEQSANDNFAVLNASTLPQNEVSLQVVQQLRRVWSERGQNIVHTMLQALKKPNDQDVVIQLFAVIRQYFQCSLTQGCSNDIEQLEQISERRAEQVMLDCVEQSVQIKDFKNHVEAILFLSLINESLLDTVFGLTDAIGSVMRKRIAHLSTPIRQRLETLMN